MAPQVAHPGLAADTGVGWVRLNLILGQQWSHPLDAKRPQGLTWAETYRFIFDSYRSRQLRIYALVGHEAVAEGGRPLPRRLGPTRWQTAGYSSMRIPC